MSSITDHVLVVAEGARGLPRVLKLPAGFLSLPGRWAIGGGGGYAGAGFTTPFTGGDACPARRIERAA